MDDGGMMSSSDSPLISALLHIRWFSRRLHDLTSYPVCRPASSCRLASCTRSVLLQASSFMELLIRLTASKYPPLGLPLVNHLPVNVLGTQVLCSVSSWMFDRLLIHGCVSTTIHTRGALLRMASPSERHACTTPAGYWPIQHSLT